MKTLSEAIKELEVLFLLEDIKNSKKMPKEEKKKIIDETLKNLE